MKLLRISCVTLILSLLVAKGAEPVPREKLDEWKEIPGCMLMDNKYSDGDSFHILLPDGTREDIARTEQKDADGNLTREGTYRTKDRILEIYDQMLQARRTGEPWQSPLDPPPGPPTDAEGNYLPMAEWPHHPGHIHPPKGEALPQDALRHFTDLLAGDIPARPFAVALPDDIADEAKTFRPLGIIHPTS